MVQSNVKRVLVLALDALGRCVEINEELTNFWNFFTLGARSFRVEALKPSAYNWISMLHGDTKLLFVHLTDVDEYGHQHEFGSTDYLNQVKVMDLQIGEILES
ncbi:27458_t:CDS:2, partial [Racocetra persica]